LTVAPDNIVTKLAATDYTEYEGTASYSDTGSSQNLTEASKPSTCCGKWIIFL